MKKINQFIIEKLKLSKNDKIYNYHPKTKDELQQLIIKLIKERGNDADLNDIDVSKITDMFRLFDRSEFNGDISKWDVSNVKDMEFMFAGTNFNGDISDWDVSKVEDMYCMFYSSKFKGDISQWDVSNVKDMKGMFRGCPLQKNPPSWYKYKDIN